MRSHALTHLVLVREVVGIKSLRGEQPPEEKNSQTNSVLIMGLFTHTHNPPTPNTPQSWAASQTPLLSLPLTPPVRSVQCVWSHNLKKVPSAYKTADSSFTVIHLKPHQSIGTKSPQMSDSESARCPCCSRSERVMEWGETEGGEVLLLYLFPEMRQSERWELCFLPIKEDCVISLFGALRVG